jgi:DNA modification methylase
VPKLVTGDCVEELKKLADNSVDSIVTDPPYGLKFMGKEFDDLGEGAQQREWHKRWAVEALRVLKPGGHLLAFGGTRTYHHLATAVEDAGFEIRDQMQWLYGSGFPKSHNVGKAIDKKRHDREQVYQVTGWIREARNKAGIKNSEIDKAFNANTMARHWTDVPPNGKQPAVPTLEQIPKLLEVLGVKEEEIPEDIHRLIYELNGKKGQPGENWFKREVVGKTKTGGAAAWTNGMNNKDDDGERYTGQTEWDLTAPATDAAAKWEGWGTALKPANEPVVVARKPFKGTVAENVQEHGTGALNIDGCRVEVDPDDPNIIDKPSRGGTATKFTGTAYNGGKPGGELGRGPTLQHPEGRWPANIILDPEAGAQLDEQSGERKSPATYNRNAPNTHWLGFGRKTGEVQVGYGDQGGASRFFYCPKAAKGERNAGINQQSASNVHPTVKPIDLMRYLCRLVTPPGGTVLDPFLGSGTTGIAAHLEGFEFIGIEREAEYMEIAAARIDWWSKQQGETKEVLKKSSKPAKKKPSKKSSGKAKKQDK